MNQDEQIKILTDHLRAITLVAGNLPDESITSKTGPNDAVHRGLMVVEARRLAKQALVDAGLCKTTMIVHRIERYVQKVEVEVTVTDNATDMIQEALSIVADGDGEERGDAEYHSTGQNSVEWSVFEMDKFGDETQLQ